MNMKHPLFSRVPSRHLYGAALLVSATLFGINGCAPEVSSAESSECSSNNTVCGVGRFCSFSLTSLCGTAGDRSGTCEAEPDMCPQQFSPVCGCDDQTYDNECLANAAGVSIVRPGKCPGIGDPCTATGLSCGLGLFCNFPVSAGCGNEPGVCEAIPDQCSQQFVPVCGCDRVTYSNECLARAAGVSVAGPGECGG
jgi:hypothetical protein